jgi:TetR/AcrR family transcriptional repressor of bet genes
MGRPSNSAQRRAEICRALEQEVALVGYQRASIKSIAARAGLAPGLVHYHFPDKESILLVLLEDLIARADARARSAAAGRRDPEARLRAFIAARLGAGGADAEREVRVWLNLIAEATALPAVRERVARWFGSGLRQLAREFRSAGSDEPLQHAAILMSMVLGAFSLHGMGVPGVPAGFAQRQAEAWLGGALPPGRKRVPREP